MSKRHVWVIEVSIRGADHWRPMEAASFTVERVAQRHLKDYQEPPRAGWEYRLVRYASEAQ
jgi:hypothetical protein